MNAYRQADLEEALRRARQALLAGRDPRGVWAGHLSDSALATATAVFALATVDPDRHAGRIHAGIRWLTENANPDGGWGDCPGAPSNLSATLLVWTALGVDVSPPPRPARAAAEAWITDRTGGLDPGSISASILHCYGHDQTFAAPILSMCALGGRLGPEPDAWKQVTQLPCELAVLPQRFFRWLNLRVVSYALPALIAVGLLRLRRADNAAALRRALAGVLTRSMLARLARLQPEGGGFLEAVPLTAFVVMGLAGAERRSHQVLGRGVAFLLASQRANGSWPIDSNLATWLTSHAVRCLTQTNSGLTPTELAAVRRWLLTQQRPAHPFTGAMAGGWSWTDLPGGVPDADDTAGALLALHRTGAADATLKVAAGMGVNWLLGLQNRDGGIPTFCRGWGKLPFDRSCPDITAHALHAIHVWRRELPPSLRRRARRALRRGVAYLAQNQARDGYWTPLWFGNPAGPEGANPVYGTARVLLELDALRTHPVLGSALAATCQRGRNWLLGQQNPDGGWGGARGVTSALEETGIALAALATPDAADAASAAVERGTAWLLQRSGTWQNLPVTPVGLYFASLRYTETLYPLLFALLGLTRVRLSRGDTAT